MSCLISDEDAKGVKVLENGIELTLQDGNNAVFEDCWLRDHCRCSSCYHADTCQRAKHILEIPESKITDASRNSSQLYIKWDDGHKSVYDIEFLSKFDYKSWNKGRTLKPIVWNGRDIAHKLMKVHVDKFLRTEEGVSIVFQHLLDYGVALIEGVEPTTEATAIVCKALGGIQQTLFGGMWEFTTRADHADTAYTNLPLAVHNDNTYFTEAAGLQVLHCLVHSNGSGGETILVDGFYGALKLRQHFPEDYDFLSKFHLEAEYIEEGHRHKYAAPVIRVNDDTKELEQIRFNVYDRAPMAFADSKQCRVYYRSLRNLARYYEDPENQWQFKLTPGTVMVMDNFRVLHGRTGFSGHRVLSGCYVSRSDWLDKARTLRLIQ
ncbi:trimethyllysine dioxygenase, mitochondrial [Plodia interpunctella]|uniref:trimethyllysine dioxygenase, mitochondrial n=1 Tax=Plodia interpunctella TaxID=58824 RepID=UPI002367E612|nr:trimethyllysine dioxygenase, mitochondrial [Plodia interpunctella]